MWKCKVCNSESDDSVEKCWKCGELKGGDSGQKKQYINTQRIVLLVLGFLGCITVFLPWATLPILGEINGFKNGTGMFSFLGFVIVAILSLALGSPTETLNKNHMISIAIVSLITSVSGFYFYMTYKNAVEDFMRASNIVMFGISMPKVYNVNDFSLGYGSILTISCGILLTIVSIIPWEENQKY